MPRKVRCGLIQARNVLGPMPRSPRIKKAMIDRHVTLIGEAARRKAQHVCLQELFYGPYFCAEQENALVSPHRARARRADRDAHAEARAEARDGARRAHVRGGAAGRLLQHRGRDRRRRRVPRQVPQDAHPALQAGLLGEVLLPSRQPRVPGVRDRVRAGRRLHLLRPPLPRRRARARAERRGDRLQPVGDGRRPVRVPLEARAAGARGGQRLLRGRHQPRRHGSAVEHRRVLRQQLLLRSARPDHGRGAPRQGRTCSSPTWTSI